MNSEKKYCIVFKTLDAELRGLKNTFDDPNNHKHIIPLIELTKAKKVRGKDENYRLEKRLEKVYDIFKDQEIILDLTTHEKHTCAHIDELYSSIDGYSNWIKFLEGVAPNFSSLIPAIIMEDDDIESLRMQVSSVLERFDGIAYRNDLKSDDGCDVYIKAISDLLLASKKPFVFIVDCGYIAPGAYIGYFEKVQKRIEEIKAIIPDVTIIVSATTFPKSVFEIGKFPTDAFNLVEVKMHNDILNLYKDVMYGDYGSVSPVVVMDDVIRRGWRPRIDIPLQDLVFYHGESRDGRDYAYVYSLVAQEVKRDVRYPQKLKCWGTNQVSLAADGGKPGASPSFWISVRMNIHIEQQLRRLKLKS